MISISGINILHDIQVMHNTSNNILQNIQVVHNTRNKNTSRYFEKRFRVHVMMISLTIHLLYSQFHEQSEIAGSYFYIYIYMYKKVSVSAREPDLLSTCCAKLEKRH